MGVGDDPLSELNSDRFYYFYYKWKVLPTLLGHFSMYSNFVTDLKELLSTKRQKKSFSKPYDPYYTLLESKKLSDHF